MKRSVVSAAAAAVLSSASSVQGFSITPALSRVALSPPSLAVGGGMGNIAASSSSTAMRATTVSEEDFIKTEIANNKGMNLNNEGAFFLAVSISLTCCISVVVFSKTYCPYCTRTKDLFQSLNVVGNDIMIYELDTMKNGDAIQNALLSLTGQRTVPNVFVLGQQIGGNDKTQAAAQTGRLQKMLGI
jgi:glutaredoxin 3